MKGDDTIVGMLQRELEHTPQGKWEPAQRERHREHLLAMIATREEQLRKTRLKERVYNLLLLVGTHLVVQALGLQIPGIG